MSFLGLFGPPDIEKLKSNKDINRLIKVLRHEKADNVPNHTLRISAAKALGEMQDNRAIDALVATVYEVQYWGNLYGDLPGEAIQALLQMEEDPRVIKPLLKGLSTTWDEGKLHKTIIDLAKIKRGNIINYLRKAVTDMENYEYNDKRVAVEALVEVGDPVVVLDLINALNLRKPLPYSLERFDEKDKFMIDAVASFGEKAIESLINNLKNAGVQDRVVLALTKIGTPAIQPLCDAFHTGDSEIRKLAAEVLVQLGQWEKVASFGSIAIDPLIDILNKSDKEIRERAAKALGMIGAPAVEPLVKVLEYVGIKDSDITIRKEAMKVLAIIRDVRAVEPLIAVLQKFYSYIDFRHLCIDAANALGEIGDTRAIEPLVAVLKEEWHSIYGEEDGEVYAAGAAVEQERRKEYDRLHEAVAQALKKLGWKEKN